MTPSAPRIEIDLDKIEHNAHCLVEQLKTRGIAVTGITKATRGLAAVATAMRRAGVSGIGDARIQNIDRMRRARVRASFALTRAPMPSEVKQVIRCADISFNSEPAVIAQLADAARRAGVRHGIVLMVEMGDLREGLMPADLADAARRVIELPNVFLQGIGCNLACYAGVAPDAEKMNALSAHATALEHGLGIHIDTVSGGNSANLEWALGGASRGRINNLRLGESILLGRETLHRKVLPGLHTDAFGIVAEVIESKRKPSAAWGRIAQSAFDVPPEQGREGDMNRAILALGRQDCDPEGLTAPAGIRILGASSDHLIVESQAGALTVGSEHVFQPNYSALLRAMTSAHVTQHVLGRRSPTHDCRAAGTDETRAMYP